MLYQVDIRPVFGQFVALARGQPANNDLSKQVPALCGTVWTFLRQAGVKSNGHNVAIYRGDPAKVPVEAGACVLAAFTGSVDVFCSSTPGGTAAVTTHIGPYNKIGEANAAILKACAERNLKLAGVSWEIY